MQWTAKLRRGDVDKAFASAAYIFEHDFRTQKCLHLAFEPFASIADAREIERHDLYRLARSVVRARRNRAAARLVAEPGPHQGAVRRWRLGSKLYIKLEALVTALSLLIAAAGQDRADDGGAVLPDHEAPSTLRIKNRRRQGGRITARKCEVFWNGGAYADVGRASRTSRAS